jgi:hypothetical protein
VLVMGFVGMTLAVLCVPLYRIIHGSPAPTYFRVLFNWVLPLASLALSVSVLSYKQHKLAEETAAGQQVRQQRNEGGEETSSLLDDGSSERVKDSDHDHPLVFIMILIASLTPTIIIGLLAATDSTDTCY